MHNLVTEHIDMLNKNIVVNCTVNGANDSCMCNLQIYIKTQTYIYYNITNLYITYKLF